MPLTPISIHRQLFIIIGILLLLFLALAVWVSPWFNLLLLAAAIAMILSGITGFCALAKLLNKLPYNKRANQ